MVLALTAAAIITVLLVIWLRERVLYVIFLWAYTQNFILAWAYTSGWAGKGLCEALLISKEFLLLWLFIYFVPRLPRGKDGFWPAPLRVLGLFVAWCVLRYVAAVIVQGQGLSENLWNLRMACFPFEILAVAIGVASAYPSFAKRFIRHMLFVVVALALVGIALDVLPGRDFWQSHANFAIYNYNVKGEEIGYAGETGTLIAEAEGVTGNGVERGAFLFLSPFRAFGTVGDAVGFGHFVAFPLLLLAFCFRRSWIVTLMLVTIALALFLSFTRSAWIFSTVGFAYVLIRKKRYKLVLGIAGAAAIVLLVWAPLGSLYAGTVAGLTSNTTDPHAEGFLWFYTQGLWQLKNLFGQGMTADVPESGYALFLIRYGLPSILMLFWFCVSLYRDLRAAYRKDKVLFLVAQAVPIGMIVVLNFSYYPFSFIPYLLVWFVVGYCLAISNPSEPGIAPLVTA
jgi:hypothetical protein